MAIHGRSSEKRCDVRGPVSAKKTPNRIDLDLGIRQADTTRRGCSKNIGSKIFTLQDIAIRTMSETFLVSWKEPLTKASTILSDGLRAKAASHLKKFNVGVE